MKDSASKIAGMSWGAWIWVLCTLAAPAAASAVAPMTEKEAPGQVLSSRLDALATAELRDAGEHKQATALSVAEEGGGSLLRDGSRVVVTIEAAEVDADLREQITAAGAEITYASADYPLVTVSIDESKLRQLARIPGIERVAEELTPFLGSVGEGGETPGPASGSHGCEGLQTSEGDAQLRAHEAREIFGVDGSGVEVGVLSDSFNVRVSPATTAAQDVANGDLPGAGNPCGRTTPVDVIDEVDVVTNRIDEGRGMLQIVHDLAPGANLAFASAFNSHQNFADNIRALAAAGADVIVDDVIHAQEPTYQDGPVAKAINDVTAAGVVYHSMAFNNNIIDSMGRNIGSWETTSFRDGGACGGGQLHCLDFNPAVATNDASLQLTQAAGKSFTVFLHFAQPWNGVTSDLDLYVTDCGANILGQGIADNLITDMPFEFAGVAAPGAARPVCVFVDNNNNVGTPRVKLIFSTNSNGAVTASEYPTSSGPDIVGPTIAAHNGAANAITVAAVPFNNSATVEPFSSRGPVTKVFGPAASIASPAAATLAGAPITVAKPDIAATDGGANTFFGQNVGGGLFRFFGTSAAAPHAAAVAALQLDATPAATVAQIRNAQTSTADPVGALGPSAVGGGLLDAVEALDVLATPIPPAPPSLTGTSPISGTNENSPKVIGTAPAGTTINLYESSNCSGPLEATGTAAGLASPGLAASVGDNTSNQFSATATNGNGTSLCSNSITYAEVTPVTPPPDPTPADTTSPETTFTKQPDRVVKTKRTQKNAKFELTASEPGSFICLLDGKPRVPCVSPLTTKVGIGKHTLQVQAVDVAGNTEDTPAVATWKLKRKR